MNTVRRIVIGVLAALLVLALVLGAVGVFTVRRSFPLVQGEIRLAGLDAPVEIYRDPFGIPHIYAQTTHDLFLAQGYVHAQDRFWQMDFWRHLGAGRLAEMFGETQVDVDKFLRTLGWARVAETELASSDPETLLVLEAYAEGVNAYLADHQGSELSLEYAILGLLTPGYQPEPWEPANTLTFVKVMALDLGRSKLDGIIQRALLLKTLGPDRLSQINPPYPQEHPVIVKQPHLTGQAPQSHSAPRTYLSLALPALESLQQQLVSLEGLVGTTGSGVGSNSWVVSGALTDTGMPYLANDPHLPAQMPSIWYEVGLHCVPKGPECPFEVAGFSFASAPGVVIGHNDRIAWGLTNLGPDVADLYIEKINPDNPNQYEVDGEWVDMEIVPETLRVAGGDPVELTVRHTRHGPLISDVYGLLEAFGEEAGVELPDTYALAFRWTALQPGFTHRAILGFNQAQDWGSFRQAAADFSYPSQNLVYADVDGNIGYQAPGLIPLRNPGHIPELPVPGWTDDYEWQGFIPFDELPHAFNPPEGYLVTANNAVVGPDYPYPLSRSWAYGHRAQRIVDLIETAPRPLSLQTMRQIQGDDMDLNAVQLVPLLLQVSLEEDRLIAARDLLLDWDYQSHMDSAPAAVFQAFWRHLLAETFHDEMPESDWPGGGSLWFEVVRQIAADPNSGWWDDQRTPASVESRDQIIQRAFDAAVNELEELLGKNPSSWAWGDLHTLTFRNQTLGVSGVGPIEMLFNRGPYRTSGGSEIVNATGWRASESYQVRGLPSMRMVVDLSDLANSLAIHPTGQSGHAYHPHYVDMADLWRTIGYHPMLWERSDVEAQAEGHLRLVPAG